MRFLFEAEEDLTKDINNIKVENDIPNLSQIKQQLEKSGTKYEDLNDSQRTDFILKVLKQASNKKTLSQARLSVVNSIKKSRWDKDIIDYLSNLPNDIKISDPIIELTSNLIMDNKLDYRNNQDWINNTSIYDRSEKDTLTTIKALTLINNPDLQKAAGGKSLFSKNLTTNDFKDGSKFFNASKIKDILDDNTSQDITIKEPTGGKGNTRVEIKRALKDNNIDKTDREIDKVIDENEELIKQDLISALMQFGVKEGSAKKLVQDNYTNEKTFEELLREMLRGLSRGA